MSVVQVRDCETAADVRQNLRDVAAKRRAGRIPVPAPVPIPPPSPVWVPAAVKRLSGDLGEWANEIAPPPPLSLSPPRPITGEIIKAVARAYGFTSADIRHPRRDKELCHARHVSMLLCKILTKLGDRRIAWAHGRTDHSTVLHARRKLAELGKQLQAIHVPDDPPNSWAASAARLSPLPELSRDYVRRLEGEA